MAEGQFVLRRPQNQYSNEQGYCKDRTGHPYVEDGEVHFNQISFPPMPHHINLPETAEVILPDRSVQTINPATDLAAYTGRGMLYQPARLLQRVEVLPAGFGDWEKLITTYDNFLGNKAELQGGSLSVNVATDSSRKTCSYQWQVAKKAPRKSKVRRHFKGSTLAGYGADGVNDIPIYYKGEWNIIDGNTP